VSGAVLNGKNKLKSSKSTFQSSLSFTMLLFLLAAHLFFSANLSGQAFATRDDTIPSPPAGPLNYIYGPDSLCAGDTGLYIMDAPVGVECEWLIDGVIQATNECELEVVWTDSGNYAVVMIFNYPNGSSSVIDTLEVFIDFFPDVNLGNDTTIYQGQTLTLDAGNPGAEYLWSTGESTQTISVTGSGTYSVNVTTGCGIDFDEIVVTVFVSIEEARHLQPKFSVRNNNFTIIHKKTPEKIEIYNLSGSMIKQATGVNSILLPSPGLFVARVYFNDEILSAKVLSK
jgi:hypothetical protein